MSAPNLYPVAILQDRYTGVYSGGPWIAVAEADTYHGPGDWLEGFRTRLGVVYAGAHGDDIDASHFWREHASTPWIAVGGTPDTALAALRTRMAAPTPAPAADARGEG